MAHVIMTNIVPEHASQTIDAYQMSACIKERSHIYPKIQSEILQVGGRRRDRRRPVVRKVWKVRKEDSENRLTNAPHFINGPGMSACLLVSEYFLV